MLDLKNLGQPGEFWEYFEQISKIPRCSKNEEKIRNFVQNEAGRLGFTTRVDDVGNLAVRVPAKTQQKLGIVLQCHLDMICEKNEGTKHDFSKDPLKLKIIEIDNEKWLTAEGTTLGGDNGKGICYILTLMKKIYNHELEFDSLGFDFLFTVREEYDMGGAENIGKDLIEGDYLINLDSGGESKITIGCVGGIGFKAKIFKKSIQVDPIKDDLLPIKLTINGLKGGHSGGDSNKGRGNAIKILSQILWKLNNLYSIHLNSINGGGVVNAIPREAFAIFFVKINEIPELCLSIKDSFTEIKKQYDSIEDNMDFTIEELEDYTDNEVLPKEIQDKLFALLYIIPSGAMSMHPILKTIAYTSTNLGVIKSKKNYIKIQMLHRSFSKYHNEELCEKVITLLKMSGLEMEKFILTSHPPWIPNFDSKLLKIAEEAYLETFKKSPKVRVIHGGLETRSLLKHYPGMEAIAIGPTNKDGHSPDERLQVKSVERVWNFLLNLLKKLD